MSADDRRPQRAADEPFLSRWARLKREAREADATALQAPPAAAAPEPPADEPSAVTAEGAPGRREDAPGAVPELPPLDSLTAESDFGAFMAANVSPELRRQALRKMFTSAKYAVVDPLDPYRADYGAFTALGDTVTSDMKYHAERLLRRELERAAEAAEAAGNAAPEGGEETAAANASETAALPDETAEADADASPGAPDDEQAAQDRPTTPRENDDERRDG
jgi:hypothetical protein